MSRNCATLIGAILVMGGTVTACVYGESEETGGSSPLNPNVPTSTSAADTNIPPVSTLPPGRQGLASWLYQLAGYPGGRLDAIAASPHPLAVIDLARDGSTGYFTRSEIEQLRRAGKRVLAYFEIGAIERYRPEYRVVVERGLVLNRWQDWPGEHFVQYWDPAWWEVAVRPRVDQAVRAGFDGVYLDAPLAYEEIDRDLVAGQSRRGLARKMVDLIVRISRYAKAARPGFWVFPQNSPELAEYPGFTTAIEGIGIEELFFRASDTRADLPCTARWCAENLAAVREIRDAGKLVLAVDYADQPGNVLAACRRYRQERFAGYVTVRALDRIRPQCEGV